MKCAGYKNIFYRKFSLCKVNQCTTFAFHYFLSGLKKIELPLQTYQYPDNFILESGEALPKLEISYYTYGTLNESKDNEIGRENV